MSEHEQWFRCRSPGCRSICAGWTRSVRTSWSSRTPATRSVAAAAGAPVGAPGGADITCFSLHPVKAMTTGEGGVAVTEDDELARRLRLFRTHGIAKEGVDPGPTDGGWYMEMQELGFNYRITDFQCALGLSQLERLDAWVERRNEVAARYRELLGRRGAGGSAAGGAGGRPARLPPVRDPGPGGRGEASEGVQRSPRRRHRRAGALHPGLPDALLPGHARAIPQDEWPATEEYYGGAISLPIFPAMSDSGRGARGRHAPRAAVSFRTSFEIGGKQVGGGAPCYVVAEAGANHNRDLDVARELIDAAADAGCDAVKFQTYSGASIYSSKTPRFEYLKDERTPQELLEAISLPRDWQPLLVEHARTRSIDFFSSPFDHEAVDQLAGLGVPAMKIASFEIVDLPLIRRAAATGIPLILSTGMAVYGEIEDALGAVAEEGNDVRGAAALCVGLPVAARDHEPARDGHHAARLRGAGWPVRSHARGSPWPRAEPPWAWSCSRSTSRCRGRWRAPTIPSRSSPAN